MDNRRILGLPRNIFFLGLTSLFNDFSGEMIFAVFPAFFTSVLHAGAASLGLVDGIAEAASNFFKIYSGHLSDRLQKRKIFVVIGYAISVAARPFYLLVTTVTGALGLRFTDRVGKGLRDAPRDAIISLSIPREELGKSFGYHRAMDTMGAILGPLVAYFILLAFPYHFNTIFITSFAIGLIALATLVFISDVAPAVAAKRADIVASYRRLPSRFKTFLLAIFILSMGSLPIAVMLLKTQSIGLIIADIPLFYMLYNISYAGFSTTAGRMSDRVGAPTVILAGYLFLLVGYFVLDLAEATIPLVLAFLILGIFPALTDGVQRSLASQLSLEELRGGALGLLNAATGLGALLAGIIGGLLWQLIGSFAAIGVASIIVIVGLAIFRRSLKS